MAVLYLCVGAGPWVGSGALATSLSSSEVAAALTALCVLHSLASDLSGLPLDWSEALLRPVLLIA